MVVVVVVAVVEVEEVAVEEVAVAVEEVAVVVVTAIICFDGRFLQYRPEPVKGSKRPVATQHKRLGVGGKEGWKGRKSQTDEKPS